MYAAARLGNKDYHLKLVQTLIVLRYNFEEVDSPSFISWPSPWVPDRMYGEHNTPYKDPLYLS